MTTQDRRPPGDEEFTRRAGALLRQAEDTLDASTLSRLNRARQAALAEARGRSRRRVGTGWLAGAVVTGLAAVLVVLRPWPGDVDVPAGLPESEQLADLDLLISDESLEMLEDIEFYAVLDAELGDLPPAPAGAPAGQS